MAGHVVSNVKKYYGGSIPGGSSEASVRGKIHKIALWDVSPSDPTPSPLESWVIDLEDPNISEPSGYSKLTVSKANEIHRNGEIFGLRIEPMQNPYDDNLLIETKFSSHSGTNLEIRLSKVSDQNVLTEYVVLDYDQLAGISEHSEVQAVPADSRELKKNKIHRYSFGDGTVNGETPVYGSWLIDLDKPDPNGPEGYARVTPAEFWQSTAVNGEVPVYLQDKNANNSLTYAYLSRTDVTKSGSTVTSVFAYFVRSGYGNDLASSVGFRFTKLPGSDYLQRATSTDDSFNARSVAGIAMTHQALQSVEHTVTSVEASSGNILIPLSHFDRGVYLLNIQLYAGGHSSHFGSSRIPLRISFRYRFDGSDSWTLEHTGALEQVDQNGPWYYGSTIQLNTDLPTLTGVDVEFYFGANKLVENDTINVKINYTLLSKPS